MGWNISESIKISMMNTDPTAVWPCVCKKVKKTAKNKVILWLNVVSLLQHTFLVKTVVASTTHYIVIGFAGLYALADSSANFLGQN